MGYHRALVKVPLPTRGESRKHFLTRKQAAKLLWVCWSTPEMQEGQPTKKRPLRHLCRYLIATLYTGSRPGTWLAATWDRGPGRAWVDIDGARFHRQPEGSVPTDKRLPPVPLNPRLLGHLRRWKAKDGDRGHVVRFDGAPLAEPPYTALRRACKLAKLDEGVTAYAMRHTAATWLIAKGLSVKLVADYLGTSAEMIERHYGHAAPGYLEQAAAAIGRK